MVKQKSSVVALRRYEVISVLKCKEQIGILNEALPCMVGGSLSFFVIEYREALLPDSPKEDEGGDV